MDLPEAYRVFRQRLYQWAVADSHREVGQGFPLLDTIGNSKVSSLLRLMAPLTVDERTALTDALVRQAYRSVLSEMGIPLTPEDRENIQKYKSFHTTRLSGGTLISAPAPPAKRLISKTRMLGLINKSLFPVLGVDTSPVGKGVTCFTTPIDNWVMKTFVGVHSKGVAGVYYYHVLDRLDRPLGFESRLQMISVMIWLGLGQTEWTLSSASPYAIVASLAAVISHFTEAVPTLTGGLD